MKKGLKIFLLSLVAIVVLAAVLYKPVYEYVAPKVFDYIVERNIDTIVRMQGEELAEEILENEDDYDDKNEEKSEKDDKGGKTDEKNADDSKSKSKASADSKYNENNDDGVYKSKTHIGVLTTNDLTHLLKVISASDKTRIISIVQSCVSPSDYPELLKRAKNMSNADKAYIEAYLRSHMGASQKKEILDIVAKYR